LGAGCRRFKSSRPDQSSFETKLRKETATAEAESEAGHIIAHSTEMYFELRLGKPDFVRNEVEKGNWPCKPEMKIKRAG